VATRGSSASKRVGSSGSISSLTFRRSFRDHAINAPVRICHSLGAADLIVRLAGAAQPNSSHPGAGRFIASASG
jgi:hypothetical protein